MRFDKVELSLVPGNLLGIALSNDLFHIVLSNKTQNSNRICFIIQGLKIVTEEVGTEDGSSKILRDMMH